MATPKNGTKTADAVGTKPVDAPAMATAIDSSPAEASVNSGAVNSGAGDSVPVNSGAVNSGADAAIAPERQTAQTAEEEITQAIQVLSTLATLKLKTQESKDQSLDVLRKIESLFRLEEPISPQDLEELKSGFKTLNKFALAVNQYYETKTKAEAAKKVLDTILGSFKASTH